MNSINNLKGFKDDVIGSYVDMGTRALDSGQYQIAYKMYKAAFEEPSSRVQKTKFLGILLVNMGRAHEGLRQLYKAKLLYIRALAHHRKQGNRNDALHAELLIRLARITAEQGLYKQSSEFASQAMECVSVNAEAASGDFEKDLDCLRSIYQSRARVNELFVLERRSPILNFAPQETLTRF